MSKALTTNRHGQDPRGRPTDPGRVSESPSCRRGGGRALRHRRRVRDPSEGLRFQLAAAGGDGRPGLGRAGVPVAGGGGSVKTGAGLGGGPPRTQATGGDLAAAAVD